MTFVLSRNMGWGCQHQVQFCKQRTGESCSWVLAIRGRLRSGPNTPTPWCRGTGGGHGRSPHLGGHQRQGPKFRSWDSWTGEATLDLGPKWGSSLLSELSLGVQPLPTGQPWQLERGTKGGGQRRGHVPPDLRCSGSSGSLPLSQRGGGVVLLGSPRLRRV